MAAPTPPGKLAETTAAKPEPIAQLQQAKTSAPIAVAASTVNRQALITAATLVKASKSVVFKPVASLVYKPILVFTPPKIKLSTITYQVWQGLNVMAQPGGAFTTVINFTISGPATTIDFTYSGLPAGITAQTTKVNFAGNTVHHIYLNFFVPLGLALQKATPFVIHYSGYNGAQKGNITVQLQIWSGFPMQHQLYNEWCWAATTTSMDHYYNPDSTLTQCHVVNQQKGRSDCCSNGGSSDCNQPGHTGDALDAINRLDHHDGSAASYATVVQQTALFTPIAMRIGWSGGGGHAIVASGYEHNSMVVIDDPWYGPSVVTYHTLLGTYHGSGTWTDSYYTKR
jgi:hypothetical protein